MLGRLVIRLMRSQPVALLGESLPRVRVAPPAETNSWQDVSDLSARAGVPLDDWQKLILEAAMGERADLSWAAKRVGVSVPRQNGKSQLMVARALAGALIFGEKKIVISAHQADTAREAFSKLVEMLDADGNEWLRSRLDPKYGRGGVMNAINREAVKFANGALIQFKARTLAGGRGFSSDCLLLDEAQRLGRAAWASINSTMSARANPQVWLLGTPPTKDDDGEVFESVRASAVDGVSNASAWLEWGLDAEHPAYEAARVALLSSPRVWTPEIVEACWWSNPAWNTRINHEVVQGEFETYTPEQFALDRLGMWAGELRASRLITAAEWEATSVVSAPAGGARAFGVAFNIDGSRMALAGAVKHDGGVHVEAIDAMTGEVEAGIGPLADWLAERWRSVTQIAISGQAGAAALEQALLDRGVRQRVIHVLSGPEVFASNSMFYDGVRDRTITHPAGKSTDHLERAVAVCDRKVRSKVTGAWGWAATTDGGDETPLEAVGFANWAVRTAKARTGKAVFA